MVEGRGYTGRLAERHRERMLRNLIKNKDNIIVIPDIADNMKTGKKPRKRKIKR
jgi:hypothetical protein